MGTATPTSQSKKFLKLKMPRAPKAIKLTLLINSERTHPPNHRLTILSRHCHRLSRTHSRTSDSAKCERLSDRSHALTIPALSKESRIEDMLSDFAEILGSGLTI